MFPESFDANLIAAFILLVIAYKKVSSPFIINNVTIILLLVVSTGYRYVY